LESAYHNFNNAIREAGSDLEKGGNRMLKVFSQVTTSILAALGDLEDEFRSLLGDET
jgi:hypothetical protein